MAKGKRQKEQGEYDSDSKIWKRNIEIYMGVIEHVRVNVLTHKEDIKGSNI